MGSRSHPLRDVSPTTGLLAVAERLAPSLVTTLLASERVPLDTYVYQTRRSIGCDKSKPFHMLLAVALDDADDVSVPVENITAAFLVVVALIHERRRNALAARTGGTTHAIARPSVLPAINREARFENAENDAERAVLSDEEDPQAIRDLLAKSAREIHEQQARDAELVERLARLELRQAVGR